ncbi:MAG: spiro-SPASM protein [Spirochaetes bacterium]|nr:spiro-SPASM protein [Spirochaetota bacterium]
MKTAVVLNGLLDGSYWTARLAGKDPIEEVCRKASNLSSKNGVFVLLKKNAPETLAKRFHGCTVIRVADASVRNVLALLSRECRSYGNIVYWYADAPLLDLETARRMVVQHREELAEYTRGEGFPEGLVPEVLRVGVLPKLESLVSDYAGIGRNSIFETLSKRINTFDIETCFSSEDMRLRRIELLTSSRRTRLLVERVAERAGFECGFEDIRRLLHEQPETFRSLPSYVEIEITRETSSGSVYSPLPAIQRPSGSMPYDGFKTALDRVLDFTGGVHLALSLYGDPLMHADIRRIVEYAVGCRDVELILETDGTRFLPEFSDWIYGLGAPNLHIIFEVDAVSEAVYRRVRNADLNTIERNIRYLLDKGMTHVYVQMVRMDSNEEELLQFFERWDKEAEGAIIQKYSTYLGALPERSSADLLPLERSPCWHLQRDLVVFSDGKIPRCRQDINGRVLLGDLFSEPLFEIWQKGEPFFISHCRGRYDEYCKSCDEWFTFNF